MPAVEARSQTFCPHCDLLIADDASGDGPRPRSAMRCPHCRLVVGPGRGLNEPSEEPGARGTAAGVIGSDAKREREPHDKVAPEVVLAAIREIARQLGKRPDRLPMVDYQQATVRRPDLPVVADVIEVFGSWKSARGEARA